MSETPDITNLFRSKHDSWDPDSELGSIIYLTREPITKIPTKPNIVDPSEIESFDIDGYGIENDSYPVCNSIEDIENEFAKAKRRISLELQ